MLVTFMRCEWRGGSGRLIKAAGMLIGRGHCCPLCSAHSYWASVVPVKGQRTDLKSVTLTPHTRQHPPLPPDTYVHRLSHLRPPSPSPPILNFWGFPEENGTLLLLSFPPCCLIRWLALTPAALHRLWSVWPLQLWPGQAASLFEVKKFTICTCFQIIG